VDNSKKVGGLWRSEQQLEGFRNSLSECNLGDMGFSGSKYTWSNKRNSLEFIKERLNRALATPGWSNHFPFFEVEVLATRTLGHKPLWLRFSSTPPKQRRPKSFKFEAYWNVDEECAQVIKEAWDRGGDDRVTMGGVLSKLNSCSKALTSWSSAKYGALDVSISRLTRNLEQLQRNKHQGNLENIKMLQEELNQLMEMEDIRWRQRAK
jgi:hypothetical protein